MEKSLNLPEEQVSFLNVEASQLGQTSSQRLHELIEQFKNHEWVLKTAVKTEAISIAQEDMVVLENIAARTNRSVECLLSTIIDLRCREDFFEKLKAAYEAHPYSSEEENELIDW